MGSLKCDFEMTIFSTHVLQRFSLDCFHSLIICLRHQSKNIPVSVRCQFLVFCRSHCKFGTIRFVLKLLRLRSARRAEQRRDKSDSSIAVRLYLPTRKLLQNRRKCAFLNRGCWTGQCAVCYVEMRESPS